MNLTEAVKKVLKSKSKSILKNFWKDDLIIIFSEIGEDILNLGRVGKGAILTLKKTDPKNSVVRIIKTGRDTVVLFKVVPSRVRDGFKYFKDDFLEQLDRLETSKQKTTFVAKTLAALVSISIPGIQKVRRTKKSFSVKNLKTQNAFVQFIFYQLTFKVSQLIIYRFLEALEDELSHETDLQNVRYFKSIITGGSRNYDRLNGMEVPVEGDPSFEILERLKHFLMTGER